MRFGKKTRVPRYFGGHTTAYEFIKSCDVTEGSVPKKLAPGQSSRISLFQKNLDENSDN
jgi:hypothetical protein